MTKNVIHFMLFYLTQFAIQELLFLTVQYFNATGNEKTKRIEEEKIYLCTFFLLHFHLIIVCKIVDEKAKTFIYLVLSFLPISYEIRRMQNVDINLKN